MEIWKVFCESTYYFFDNENESKDDTHSRPIFDLITIACKFGLHEFVKDFITLQV